MRFAIVIACAVLGLAAARPALAEVDVQTPWSDVYVGPEGVYVHGPWGRVEVPSGERERVCAAWRRKVEAHYKRKGCEVDFDSAGCTIEEVDCDD